MSEHRSASPSRTDHEGCIGCLSGFSVFVAILLIVGLTALKGCLR